MRLVLCTFPDIRTARQVGMLLVEKQLAACVNLVPGVESMYRWEGKVETRAEVLAVFKTTAAALARFSEALAALHPYEVPEIVALEPSDVSPAYLAWVLENASLPPASEHSRDPSSRNPASSA